VLMLSLVSVLKHPKLLMEIVVQRDGLQQSQIFPIGGNMILDLG